MYVKKNWMSWVAVFTLALPLMIAGTAGAAYKDDGAVQVSGAYKAPSDGICVLGIHADGTMDVDATITNKRDCDARLISGLTGTCGSSAQSGDGAKHANAGGSTCVTVDGSKIITGTISMKDLDRSKVICTAKGGFLANDSANVDQTQFASGKGCIAYGWQFRGQDANGAPLAFGTEGTANGTAGAGFCYATLRTGITPTTACPSASTDGRTKYGYAVSGSNCTYAYGIAGVTDKAVTAVDGTVQAAGATVDLSAMSMGDCLAAGYSWSNWGIIADGVNTTPSATIATFDYNKRAPSSTEGCMHCHSTLVQYNGPAERWKDSYVKTGHRNMLRKVTAGKSWSGPNADGVLETYTAWGTGGTNTIDFATAKTMVSGTERDLLYIFGDWMAPAPEGLDVIVNVGGNAKYNGTGTYSCSACHTTGWGNVAAGTGLCSKSSKTNATDCAAAGGTWVASTGVQGVQGQEPTASYPTVSFGMIGNWDKDGILCSRCHADMTPTTTGGDGHHTFSGASDGKGVTNLCFGCHQGLAKTGADGKGADVDVTVKNIGVRVSSGVADFVNHPIGPQFLNSPHAQFTGTITPNQLGKWDIAAGATYASAFKGKACFQNSVTSTSPAMTKADGTEIEGKAECESIYGVGAWQDELTVRGANGAGNCTTCHDVHNSLFVEGQEHHALRRECQTCHSDTAGNGYAATGVPQIDELGINHPQGGIQGTPFDKNLYANSCEVCHMPKPAAAGFPAHLWRINTDANYSTFPSVADISGGVKLIANTASDGQVWIDVDLACGQCHGGSKGTGATKNGAPYKTKEILASIAKTMHNANNSAPVVGSSYVVSGAKGMTVTVTDSSTDADGTADTVKLNWGDGTISTGVRGDVFTHTYTRAKTYTVAHSVTDGVQSDSEIFKVTVPKTISISGSVTGIAAGNGGVTLILKYNGHTKKRVKTASDGSFTFSGVRPITSGAYSISAYKYHVKFTNPTVVGAPTSDVTGVSITGTEW